MSDKASRTVFYHGRTSSPPEYKTELTTTYRIKIATVDINSLNEVDLPRLAAAGQDELKTNEHSSCLYFNLVTKASLNV